MSDAALILKRSVEQERDRAVGSDGRMSGVGSRGAKLGVGFDVKGRRYVTAILQARGPWQLIERDTDPRAIGAKYLGSRKAVQRRAGGGRGAFAGLTRKPNRPRALAFAGVLRATAQHPGTRGKKPWRRGIDQALEPAKRRLETQYRHALRRAIRR